MGSSLVQFMKLAFLVVAIFSFIIGITYMTLTNVNKEHHEKLNKYQIQLN
ncbi:hypothetical protein M3936_19390 [Sutcliffiella horikoshii]|nr:hypothetical protein [Sutcliffiella horikoshii]MCM3619738.1 hypothetical protein [Sutcliffiella horikoshii]UAL49889.1 hypothetical protein K7887_22490 [Sutcliffiella horikoshii]